MKISLFIIRNFLLVLLFLFIITSCGKEYTSAEKTHIERVEKYRTKNDSIMKFSPTSPFNAKGKIEFHPLKYFPVSPDWLFRSKLYEYENKDTVTVFGTKGDERKNVRHGYLKLNKDGKDFIVNVYSGISWKGNKYYTIWFTDKTTGEETYGVGRYINFNVNEEDSTQVYTVDFNMAYNPYCAYSPEYSCTVPLKEDYIDLAIKAGEKKFHK